MAQADPPGEAQPADIAQQLERTTADLRTLAEQLGAIPPGSATKVVSQRQATITFVAVVALAALAAWFIWDHWHSLLAATAPIIWVFVHGWRHRRRQLQRDRSGGA
jgi:hypothetical protein